MYFRFLFALTLALTTQTVMAQTVIYTTARYPVDNPEPGVVVQVLEDVRVLEQSLFPALTDDAAQAEQQARQLMASPGWPEQEARLTRAYQALADAWALGIQKVPAVVFDNHEVVYGTTDIHLAQQIREEYHNRERRP